MTKSAADALTFELPLIREALARRLPAATVAAVATALEGVLTPLQAFDQRRRDLDADQGLSEVGRRDRAREAAETATKALATWRTTYAQATQEQVDQLLASLTQPPPPKDPSERLLLTLQQQEARAGLRELEPAERDAIYAGADEALAIAMETAPPVVVRLQPGAAATLVPFVSPDRVEHRQLARATARDPAKAAQLDALKTVATVYASWVNSARTHLEQAVGEPVAEPIAS